MGASEAERISGPAISVVIPTRGREARLAFALEALAAQTPRARRLRGDRRSRARCARARSPRRPRASTSTSSRARSVDRGRQNATTGGARREAPLVAFTDDDCRPDGGLARGAAGRARGGAGRRRRPGAHGARPGRGSPPPRAGAERARRRAPSPWYRDLQHRLPEGAAGTARRLRRGLRGDGRGHRPRPAGARRGRRAAPGGAGDRPPRRPRATARKGDRGRLERLDVDAARLPPTPGAPPPPVRGLLLQPYAWRRRRRARRPRARAPPPAGRAAASRSRSSPARSTPRTPARGGCCASSFTCPRASRARPRRPPGSCAAPSATARRWSRCGSACSTPTYWPEVRRGTERRRSRPRRGAWPRAATRSRS